MQPFVFFSLLTAGLSAVNQILSKITAKYALRRLDVFLFYFFLVPITFIPFLATIGPVNFPLAAPSPVLAQSVSVVVAYVLLYSAIFRGDVSVIGAMFPLKLIFVPFLAYFMVGEAFDISIYIWIAGMIFGGILVANDERYDLRSFVSRPVLLVLTSMFFFALQDVFAARVLVTQSPISDLAWVTLLSSLSSVVLFPFVRNHVRIGLKQFGLMVLISAILLALTLSILFAFRQNVTLSNSLAMLNSPFLLAIILVISRFRPGFLEQHSPRIYLIRILGSMIMYFSAVQIVVR